MQTEDRPHVTRLGNQRKTSRLARHSFRRGGAVVLDRRAVHAELSHMGRTTSFPVDVLDFR